MKKLAKFLIFISIVLVCALMNVIVFLTIPQERLDTTVFWMAWAFATPWNLLMTIVLHVWANKKGNEILKMPPAYYLCGVFGLIYFALGFIFMYASITTITLLLILELAVTVIYILAAIYVCTVGNHIAKNERVTKQKVFFIRMLQSNVTSCLPSVKDPEMRAALEELSEKIRFSDPMSHQALALVEGELAATVDEITAKILSGDENISALIQKAEMQLARRNSQCAMLK